MVATPPLRLALVPALLGLLGSAAVAAGAEPQGAGRSAQPPIVEPAPLRDEPVVQHIVIDERDTRIEELHVRGETKRITVKPKAAPKLEYEVIPAGGERDMAPGPGSTRGAAGQRVWKILNF